MAAYTFDFAVVGADDDASLAAGGHDCLVDLPQTHFILTSNANTITQCVSAVDPNLRSVGIAHLAVALSAGAASTSPTTSTASPWTLSSIRKRYHITLMPRRPFGQGGRAKASGSRPCSPSPTRTQATRGPGGPPRTRRRGMCVWYAIEGGFMLDRDRRYI